MRLAWLTDVHLDFLDEADTFRFHEDVARVEPDGVLVGGDISVAAGFASSLTALAKHLSRPVWFVLGNHDFYGGGIADVRQAARDLSRDGAAVWLGAVDVVALTRETALVGHDGWGDARYGDHLASRVLLNDFFRIRDLVGLDKAELGRALGRLGDESAAHLARVLEPALRDFDHVLVLTHVPPFREACWHEGRISGDDYLPYFACQATGDVLIDAARRWPARRITVLCGHTHSPGVCEPLPNLRVLTGGAEYRRPAVQSPLIDA
jgi:3',5'-cyclic AMP phosphodiesterase CpdA